MATSQHLQLETTKSVFFAKRIQNLDRQAHIDFLLRPLQYPLSLHFTMLDASKPWIIYWTLHALSLLNSAPPLLSDPVVHSLSKLQNAQGGFGGGIGQYSHLATTYAAINSLVIIGTLDAYRVIDRVTLYAWFLSLKQSNGSFRMSKNGEIDVRASYCVLACASLCNILTAELSANVAGFIVSCQTFEGGIGAEPDIEAHGGYTFCALAAMEILGQTRELDLHKLLQWTCARQDETGGFNGRTNKLVDGCYSFWQGDCLTILSQYFNGVLYDRVLLQEYILYCCQAPFGGLIDKPGKSPDYYHSCYCLSGLSASQHTFKKDLTIPGQYVIQTNDIEWEDVSLQQYNESSPVSKTSFANDPVVVVVGQAENLLIPTHPVYNISMDSCARVFDHFGYR